MSSVLQSPSELVPKSLKAQNAAVAKLLMSLGSIMASPVLNLQAASQDIHSAINSILKTVIDPHWSPLYFGTCWPDQWWKEARWPDLGPLVQRSEPSMGCNSCGYFCSGPLQRLCQTGWFRSYKSWGRKMPKIPWPPKQLPLSTCGHWDHWCVYGKSTAPFLSGLAKKLVDASGVPREHQWLHQDLSLAVVRRNAASILACVQAWFNLTCSFSSCFKCTDHHRCLPLAPASVCSYCLPNTRSFCKFYCSSIVQCYLVHWLNILSIVQPMVRVQRGVMFYIAWNLWGS